MKDIIKDVTVAAMVVLIAAQFYEPTRVFGVSMQPSFQENDYLIISRLAYRNKQPKRGDVIVFQSTLKDSEGKDELLIKRIIGLPGEKIEIAGGKVMIDGEVLQESYIKEPYTDGAVTMTVPEGSYFCMGDNRARSTDSRSESVGTVSADQISGKVVYRVFPFKNIGKIQPALVR
ncbi:MAG: signal peptidase I [Eubacterium sp.]|nr:signal peptidase I [Eubacterium sp.]